MLSPYLSIHQDRAKFAVFLEIRELILLFIVPDKA
jgi:hypothetical protein